MTQYRAQKQIRADVAAALSDAAFASLARAGAPIAVAEGDPAQVIYANDSALALFAAPDEQALTQKILAGDEPAARKLAHLARSILPGAAARLERVTLGGDFSQETVTFMCRRTPGPQPLFVMAGLGLRAGQMRGRPAAARMVAPFIPEPAVAVAEPSASAGSAFADSAAVEPASTAAPCAVAAPAATATAASAGVAALKADFARRFPGLPPARFLWRTDAQNIVVDITPTLAEIVGPGCAALQGRDLLAAAAQLGFDPHGRLAEALRARSTFGGVECDWPIENAAAAIPTMLGALPAFGDGHVFEGWRGYGVLHLARLHMTPSAALTPHDPPPLQSPLENSLAPVESAQAEVAPVAVANFSSVVVPLRPLAPVRPATEPVRPAPESVRPAPEPVKPAPEPVRLAPESIKPAPESIKAEPAQPAPEPAPPAPEPIKLATEPFLVVTDEAAEIAVEEKAEVEDAFVVLAPHERRAFRDIARALGARADGVEPRFAPQPEPWSELRDALAGKSLTPKVRREASPEAAIAGEGVADSLPHGLLVRRGAEILYANARLLAWLGCADLSDLRAAGGLAACIKSGELDARGGERRTLRLRGRTGESFSADAIGVDFGWEDGPARLYCLTRPSAAALEQRIGILEAGLRQREAEVAETMAIVETTADSVVLLNREGLILGLNRTAEKLLGHSRDNAAGQHFNLLLAPESQKSALDAFVRLTNGGPSVGSEAKGLRADGASLPVFIAFGLTSVTEGKYCLILRDLSAAKMAAEALEQACSSAVMDNRAKSDFVARVSHEIRTPLNAILGFAEVIIDERFGPIGNARYKDYLKDIHASGAHVMSLVNDLLDLAKIESGKLDLNFVAVDANRVVSECVSLIQPQANRERVITRLALAPRLPAILADERSLRQIVLNLLANAVRYNEPGGQVIVSTAYTGSGQAVLRVKDTGIGMNESELATALEPFRQVSSARSDGGTGLGLPLTKALAEANKASFAIRSRKSEGTLVEIVFPLAPGAAAVQVEPEKLSG